MFFFDFSAFEIHKLILSLKSSNSSSHDLISSHIIKNISLFIADVLCYIFNLSVRKGVFPDSLKTSVVIPLHKKGDTLDMNNYRPISLLSVFSKVFERGMKNRIMSFLTRTEFFSNLQFGFRSGKSTEDALLKFCSEIYKSINESNIPAALFIDITKAFDMVDHELLIAKLFKAGFRGFVFDWFRSYLTNRNQRTRIKNNLSSISIVKMGIPQGSVLGPILFLIFVNSLFFQPFKGKLTAFADDTSLSYSNKNYFETFANMNHDLEILRHWFRLHKLVISSKTKFMFFNLQDIVPEGLPLIYHAPCCSRFQLFPPMFRSDLCCSDGCFEIECVDHFKYLGITFDKKLSWIEHTSHLKLYLNKVVRQVYHLSLYCPQTILKLVYSGLVQSKLQYGICCWGGTHSYKLNQLLIRQKHSIRIISKVTRRTPSFTLFSHLGIFPVRHLYFYNVLKEFFKGTSYNHVRVHETHSLRSNNRHFVSVPRIFKSHFCHFYSVIAPRLFNKLPDDCRCERMESKFLSIIKQWLFAFNHSEIDDIICPII